MKYPQLVSVPSAVSDWLEEQLEARGIDAVVYTRYVLSLLYCRDPVDIICPDQDLHFTNPQKDVRRSSSGGGAGRKRLCRSYYIHYADADELKRSAAIECLKAASDQKCGIESLVDELCAKLEEFQSEKVVDQTSALNKDPGSEPSLAPVGKLSLQDSAKRYYAAFPALTTSASSRNSSSADNNTIVVSQVQKLRTALIPKWVDSSKRRIAKKLGSASFGVVFDDSRVAGKQKFNSSTVSNNNRIKKNMLNSVKSPPKRAHNTDAEVSNKKQQQQQQQQNVFCERADENVYQDLPVDIIRDLLESPQKEMHDEMDAASMPHDSFSIGNKYIRCGTNIISSIWSVRTDTEFLSGGTPNDFSGDIIDDGNVFSIGCSNGNNVPNGDCYKDMAARDAWNSCCDAVDDYKMQQWSEANDDPNGVLAIITNSLAKINHSTNSCFVQVAPNANGKNGLNPLKNLAFKTSVSDDSSSSSSPNSDSKEDLLHSAKSHFRPINETSKETALSSGKNYGAAYVDGTTFVIPSQLDKMDFKRSESGYVFLETEYGKRKKYASYKKSTLISNLKLKFEMRQNDCGCQTDDFDEPDAMMYYDCCDFYFPGDQESLLQSDGCDVDDDDDDANTSADYSSLEPSSEDLHNRPDSMMAELFGKESKCDKCNELDSREECGVATLNATSSASDIWNGGEICMGCLKSGSGGETPPPGRQEQHNQLRDDITQDGEQLLMDLSSLQKSYMEEMPPTAPRKISFDLNELMAARKDWNRVGLATIGPSGSAFSFATRLQQDCLIKMTTIPTLRSVTL